jgi:peptidase M28-like protein/PA domain-containing protein
MRHRRLRKFLLPVGLSVLLLGLAVAVPSNAGAITSAQCASRVNNTAPKLLECVQTNDLMTHMQALENIAIAHPGPDGHPSRNSGEPGYLASALYVANLMSQWGYKVNIQTYKFFYFSFLGTPVFRETSPVAHDYTIISDWNPGQSTGTTTAEVQPAGGIVIPPAPTTSSTSGCTAADFAGFVAGRIALIQRGGCNFGVKVLNAQAAGASGVIIFNEGNPGRTDVINGSLSDANGNRIVPTIPVAFTSFGTGQDLYNQYNAAVANDTALPTVNLEIQSVSDPNRDDYNVIAESKAGDPNHVLVVDAHLDAIYGEGMLDNASGSVSILDIAHMMAKVKPHNKMRFIWFGGEELGLLGSKYYVDNLTPTELSKVGYDLDADVTATPNYDIGILDPAAPDLFGRTVSTQFPANVYVPSQIARDQAIKYFNSQGQNHILFSPVGTDAFSFNVAGVPASGVLTGQDCCKTQDEVNLFGGYTGNYEGNVPSTDGGCVDNPFRWCDNLGNNNFAVMTFMTRGFAQMVVHEAFTNLDKSNPAKQKSATVNRKKATGLLK